MSEENAELDEGTVESSEHDLSELGPKLPKLTAEIGDWARTLHRQPSDTVLTALVDEAISLIPGTDYASLSLVTSDGRIESRAPSHSIPEYLDAVQMQLSQGPCLDSIREVKLVRVNDMADVTPWPRFASTAVSQGIRSMLTFQLFVDVESLGALNLYSSSVAAFDRSGEEIGWGLASHAALALAHTQSQGQLHEAVASRDIIGQAKGILMERYSLTEHEAFRLLIESSSRTNRKLRDVADELVVSGELPGIASEQE